MRVSKLKIALAAAFVMALAAGTVLGYLASRVPRPAPSHRGGPQEDLARDLSLTADQQEQMRKIWEPLRNRAHGSFERLQALHQERDQAILALLTPEQRERADTLNREFAERERVMNAEREQVIHAAVEQTRQILTETQRAKYDRILKERMDNHHGHGPQSRPSTRP